MNLQAISIIVTYHTSEREVDRLKKEMSGLVRSVIVIDNTLSGEGYAQGLNKGIRQGLAKGTELFILANPDISLKGIEEADFFAVAKKFAIGGYAMRQNGERFYGGILDRFRLSGGLVSVKPENRFVSCDFVSGSLMIVRREVIESIGLFDESYGMYYEDVDYCLRARRAGFSVGIDSEVCYDHFERSQANPEKKRYLVKNRWKVLWKYGNFGQKTYEIVRFPKTVLELT